MNPELLAHLLELRRRLLWAFGLIGLIIITLLFVSNHLYTWIASPLLRYLPENTTLIATAVTTPLLTPIKLSVITGIFLGIPILLYQLWMFIAPALYPHERKNLFPLIFISVGLFYLGLAFAYYLVFPMVFRFLTQSVPSGVVMMTDISAYLDFVLSLFFAFGLAFQCPLITWSLIYFNVVSAQKLAESRGFVIIGAFVIGMFLTPPDAFSQTLLAVPLWLLYELGIFLGKRSTATKTIANI